MKTKALKQPTVEFFAASPRVAHAYRNAVKHNKSLARLAEIQELGHAESIRDLLKGVRALDLVVLSHADDDHRVLIDPRVEPVASGAFHLLFTDPGTHPDQVAQWMRATNIRSENRLHVVKVRDMEAPEVAQLLGRVCFALGRGGDANRGGIIDAYIVCDRLFVRGPKHRMLHIPIELDRCSEGAA